jgi:hypothetical protein
MSEQERPRWQCRYALVVVCAGVVLGAGARFPLLLAGSLAAVAVVFFVTVAKEGGVQAGSVLYFCVGCAIGLVAATVARYLYPRTVSDG